MDPIRSIYEDDPDMLEIVREFVGELPERVGQLEAQLEARDLPGLQTLAHQLKGPGRMADRAQRAGGTGGCLSNRNTDAAQTEIKAQ